MESTKLNDVEYKYCCFPATNYSTIIIESLKYSNTQATNLPLNDYFVSEHCDRAFVPQTSNQSNRHLPVTSLVHPHFLYHSHSKTHLLSFVFSTLNSHHQQSKWSTLLPPAARPPATVAASAPLRPSAPAARRTPSTAPATRPRPRTPSLGLAALAVCSPPPTVRIFSFETNPMASGARPAGQCTCERAPSENTPVSGDACPCGQRSSSKSRANLEAVTETSANLGSLSFLHL